jgi:hypothetical protein
LWALAKSQLCVDDVGWEMTNKMNKDLFSMFVETMSEELLPEAASKKWPLLRPQ